MPGILIGKSQWSCRDRGSRLFQLDGLLDRHRRLFNSCHLLDLLIWDGCCGSRYGQDNLSMGHMLDLLVWDGSCGSRHGQDRLSLLHLLIWDGSYGSRYGQDRLSLGLMSLGLALLRWDRPHQPGLL